MNTSHFLLHYDGKFYDNIKGVFTEYDYSQLVAYLEISRNVFLFLVCIFSYRRHAVHHTHIAVDDPDALFGCA